jgi:hypothetical protein
MPSDYVHDLLAEERAENAAHFEQLLNLRYLIGYYGKGAEISGNAELAALVRTMTEVLDGTWAATGGDGVMAVPPKPKRMSETRYRDLYDSDPQYVEGPGFRIQVAGLVSADVVVKTYRKEGVEPTIRPATDGGDV